MEAGVERAAINHPLQCECLLYKCMSFMEFDTFESKTL